MIVTDSQDETVQSTAHVQRGYLTAWAMKDVALAVVDAFKNSETVMAFAGRIRKTHTHCNRLLSEEVKYGPRINVTIENGVGRTNVWTDREAYEDEHYGENAELGKEDVWMLTLVSVKWGIQGATCAMLQQAVDALTGVVYL